MMSFKIFKQICILMMCDDPSNLNEEGDDMLNEWANKEAKKFGFDNWVDAYHHEEPSKDS